MRYLIVIIVCMMVSNNAAAWTISKNAEGGSNGSVATGSYGFSYSNGLTFSTDMAHGGSMSYKTTFQASEETNGASIESGGQTVAEGGEVWWRNYYYFPSGFDFSCSPVIKVLRFLTTQNGHLSVFSGSNGEIIMSNEPTDHQADSGAYFTTGAWQCIEFYIRASSTAGQGIFRIWKNGILIYNNTTYPTLAASGNSITDVFRIWTNWNGGSPVNQVAYMDDMVITNERPTNQDVAGNYMIGPTDWNGSSTGSLRPGVSASGVTFR